jgi:Membrane-associated lipoprotein involved in thiamine biosynthesis
MDNRKKNIIYSIVLMAAILVVYYYRKNNTQQEPMRLEGATMGTTYHITYFDDGKRSFQREVDSLLVMVNKSINNYDSTSEVSRFNRSRRGVKVELPYLLPPLQISKKVYEASGGAFDPTVMPLVNAWGFGPGKRLDPDSAFIDSVKAFIGFNRVTLSRDSITKSDPRVQLDFGGIGQGWGADVITDFLQSKGIKHMLVEVGGEGMAVGTNLQSGKPWYLGILDPNSTRENQFFKAYVSISDRSFTTSGSYFNYHVVDGVKYSHTIDPATGYPARKALLSASVFAPDATTADVWGTALMSMGHERAIELLPSHPEIDVFLIYSGEDGQLQTYVTEGLKPYLTIEGEQTTSIEGQ